MKDLALLTDFYQLNMIRYWTYMMGLVRGDLGESFTGVKITDLVASAFPITLQLTFIGRGFSRRTECRSILGPEPRPAVGPGSRGFPD